MNYTIVPVAVFEVSNSGGGCGGPVVDAVARTIRAKARGQAS